MIERDGRYCFSEIAKITPQIAVDAADLIHSKLQVNGRKTSSADYADFTD